MIPITKIKVGVVGFGISAKVFHVPFLKHSPYYEIIAVLERHKEESKEILPDAQIVRSMDELLLTGAELIIITTPNDTHFPYSKQALQAGRHVVVEKPFTIHSSEAMQLMNVAEEANIMLTVYQNRRYVSDYLTIKDVLQRSLLGNVHTYEAHYYRYRAEARADAWREKQEPGSGILYDLGAHLIDQCLQLFGLPAYITADVRRQRSHAQTDDWFIVNLDYGFLQATLKAGMLVREPGPRYMIHGTKGSFIKSGEDPQEAKLRAGESPSDNLGKEGKELYGLLHTEVDGHIIKEKVPSLVGDYGLFYEELYQTLQYNKPTMVKPVEAFNVIRIIELAFESSEKKCTLTCEGLLDE